MRKKVINVFAIAMLIAGMYSCSSDDDTKDSSSDDDKGYKEVALTNDWLNGKWYIDDIIYIEKSVINVVDDCENDYFLTFNSKDLTYEFQQGGKSACDGIKLGEVFEKGIYKIEHEDEFTYDIQLIEEVVYKGYIKKGYISYLIDVKAYQKGEESKLSYIDDNFAYILRRE